MELLASKLRGSRKNFPSTTFKQSKLEGIIMSPLGLKLIAIMFHMVTLAFLHDNKKIPVQHT